MSLSRGLIVAIAFGILAAGGAQGAVLTASDSTYVSVDRRGHQNYCGPPEAPPGGCVVIDLCEWMGYGMRIGDGCYRATSVVTDVPHRPVA